METPRAVIRTDVAEPDGSRGPRSVELLLADGRIATIRTVDEADRDKLVELHESVSDEAVRFRFFAINRASGGTYADHLCREGTDPRRSWSRCSRRQATISSPWAAPSPRDSPCRGVLRPGVRDVDAGIPRRLRTPG